MVSGILSTTTWSGLVVVNDSITVPNGETLTVDAGTRIVFIPKDQARMRLVILPLMSVLLNGIEGAQFSILL